MTLEIHGVKLPLAAARDSLAPLAKLGEAMRAGKAERHAVAAA